MTKQNNSNEEIIGDSQTTEQERLEYPGFYDKQWYDVKARDGTILLGVRPNAGKFKKDGITIMEEDVERYRLPKGEWLNQ